MEPTTQAHDFPEPAPAPPPRPRPARWSLLDIPTAALFLLSLFCAFAMTRLGALHGNDFKHLYLGAWLLAGGGDPYDPQMLFKAARQFGLGAINPYVYLPTTGLLLRPFTLLAPGAAMLVFFWLNWALAWALVLAGPALLRVQRPALARLAGAAFLAGSLTFFRQQTAGQMNVVAAALVLGTAAALVRRRDALAGFLLALGFGWKIAPVLLIAALAPLRRTRALAWGAVFSVALFAVSVAVYGPSVHRAALPVLRQMGYGQSTWSEYKMDFYRDPFNQSPNSFFHHILTQNPHTRPWIAASPGLANALTWAVSIILALVWLIQVLRIGPIGPIAPIRPMEPLIPFFLAATLLMLLLPSLMWDHYTVQALPALLFIFGHRAVGRGLWRAPLALAIFVALTLPWHHAAWRSGPAIALMSLRLWPLLALFFWLLLDRRLIDDNSIRR